MRIISGSLKGRQLIAFKAPHIRPTTDRVKESLFNILMGHIEGARILDLFSGTGALALECISRGARHVDLVESHKVSLRIIRENLALCRVESGFKLNSMDVFKYLESYQGEPYDVILVDPPFTRSWAHRLLGEIGSRAHLLSENSQLVIEASSKEQVDESYPGLLRLDQRGFGDKNLHFFTRGSEK